MIKIKLDIAKCLKSPNGKHVRGFKNSATCIHCGGIAVIIVSK